MDVAIPFQCPTLGTGVYVPFEDDGSSQVPAAADVDRVIIAVQWL